MISIISFSIPILLLVVAGGQIVQCLILSLLLALLMVFTFAIKGVVFFATVDNFLCDESDKSIIPLFESGYLIELQNEENKLTFTTERLGVCCDVFRSGDDNKGRLAWRGFETCFRGGLHMFFVP